MEKIVTKPITFTALCPECKQQMVGAYLKSTGEEILYCESCDKGYQYGDKRLKLGD